MKRAVLVLAVAMVMVGMLAVPAMAYDNYGQAVADYNHTESNEPGARGTAVSAAAHNEGGFATTLLPFFDKNGFGPYR